MTGIEYGGANAVQHTARRQNFQTVSWCYDLYQRGLLELDPPYQRRSVWNQTFKDFFIDTVLLGYPAPAIFLYENISPDGRSVYNVVDGKQRLTTLFEFVRNEFPVSEAAEITNLRGLYFEKLGDETKRAFWGYQFLVEYVPSVEEEILNGIFDRINRNVAKLTAQELRHARLDGVFISVAEQLAEWIDEVWPRNIPRFQPQAKRQMKDVENVALLLLLIEQGPRSYSQNALDEAFTDRDQYWEQRNLVDQTFRSVTTVIQQLFEPQDRLDLGGTRLRNQADYYSLFGAIRELQAENELPNTNSMRQRLSTFISKVEDEKKREKNGDAMAYYEAARSASNDRGPRETRIRIIKKALLGTS